MNPESTRLLSDLLEQVSRSFYLTLRILPAAVRPQIGLAYLLARTSDTIADTQLVPLEQRLAALQKFRERILDVNRAPLDFGHLAERQGSGPERAILQRVEESLQLLKSFTPSDQQAIREVLRIIISGQELDLIRFTGASADHIVALRNNAELDDYTYRVAGCVGEFWTRLCRAHIFPDASLEEGTLLNDAVRFGKGLQLVNILRDIPADLGQGRCYIPSERLALIGLKPIDLRRPEVESAFRPLYHEYLALARDHLAAGWNYTVTLPRSNKRLRLGCSWPILLGVGTLKALAVRNVLEPGCPIKVARPQLRRLLMSTLLRYPFPRWWEKLFQESAAKLFELPT